MTSVPPEGILEHRQVAERFHPGRRDPRLHGVLFLEREMVAVLAAVEGPRLDPDARFLPTAAAGPRLQSGQGPGQMVGVLGVPNGSPPSRARDSRAHAVAQLLLWELARAER